MKKCRELNLRSPPKKYLQRNSLKYVSFRSVSHEISVPIHFCKLFDCVWKGNNCSRHATHVVTDMRDQLLSMYTYYVIK